VPGTIPLALRRIIVAMTARDQRDRPDAAACAKAFEEFVADPTHSIEQATVITSPADPPTRSMEIPARRWRPVHAAAGIAVLAGVTAGMLLLTGGSATPGGPTGDQPPPQPQVAPIAEVVPETAGAQIEVTSAKAQERHRGPGDDDDDDEKPDKPKKKKSGDG
jgi:hypothetical protein